MNGAHCNLIFMLFHVYGLAEICHDRNKKDAPLNRIHDACKINELIFECR